MAICLGRQTNESLTSVISSVFFVFYTFEFSSRSFVKLLNQLLLARQIAGTPQKEPRHAVLVVLHIVFDALHPGLGELSRIVLWIEKSLVRNDPIMMFRAWKNSDEKDALGELMHARLEFWKVDPATNSLCREDIEALMKLKTSWKLVQSSGSQEKHQG